MAIFRHTHYRYFWGKCYRNPILADATNLGLARMAESSQGLTHARLIWTAQWQANRSGSRRRRQRMAVRPDIVEKRLARASPTQVNSMAANPPAQAPLSMDV
jgi:hypothetical protein